VDAAYGSALLLSSTHRGKLDGIALADSVSVDFHKKFWQTISCAAFVVRDATQFRHLEVHADYLNPESHDDEGIPNLVGRSLATTRRFDALKLWLSFQLLGRQKFGAMVDRTLELAAHAARRIRQMKRFELLHEPQMGCVVFRYIPGDSRVDANALNRRVRERMFERGEAVLGHTSVHGRQCLKFTCMNPVATELDLDALLERIQITGNELEAEPA
jgi:L-2,4-diaminobutyrate decarboxylase